MSSIIRAKDIVEQVGILRHFIPNIGTANEALVGRELPVNAVGWFAIPRWKLLASTYAEAVLTILPLLDRVFFGRLSNQCRDRLMSGIFRSVATEELFQCLGKEQRDNTILVVPARLGILHSSFPIRLTPMKGALPEVGLGAFEVSVMLLTHAEFFQLEDSWIECAGDNFNAPDGGEYLFAPRFRRHEGVVILETGHTPAIRGRGNSAVAISTRG